jgi:hypothetical protein
VCSTYDDKTGCAKCERMRGFHSFTHTHEMNQHRLFGQRW